MPPKSPDFSQHGACHPMSKQVSNGHWGVGRLLPEFQDPVKPNPNSSPDVRFLELCLGTEGLVLLTQRNSANHVVFNKVPEDTGYYVTGNKSILLCSLMLGGEVFFIPALPVLWWAGTNHFFELFTNLTEHFLGFKKTIIKQSHVPAALAITLCVLERETNLFFRF